MTAMEPATQLPAVPFSYCEMSQRTINALYRAGYTNFRQLDGVWLPGIPGIGRVALVELRWFISVLQTQDTIPYPVSWRSLAEDLLRDDVYRP